MQPGETISKVYCMKFKDKVQTLIGELSRVSLDSLEQIFLRKRVKEIENNYFLEDGHTVLTIALKMIQ